MSIDSASGLTAPEPSPARAVPRLPESSIRRNQRLLIRLGWLYSAPALLLVAAVTIFPIVFSVVMSLSHVTLSSSGFALGGFTGSNYAVMFGSQLWRYALTFTLAYTFGTVLVEIIFGTLVALVLERLTIARGWLMALLLIPWAMVTVISAELWDYVYNGVYGAGTSILNDLGMHQPNLLGTPTAAIISMAAADIWKTTPFVSIIVVSGLVMLSVELTEAARIDGANGWQVFWRVTLPQLRPTLALAVLFRILQAFGLFDLPYVLTGGGPGNKTESLALLGWQTIFSDLDFGPGAAVAVSTAALTLIGCLLFLKVFRSQVGKEEL
ncbi:MAG: sugar ABC transporter permease [Streptomycetaceae bacterium]|nr:sugar ABC transporter permease [Streptomycetaceae bacterium]